MENELSQQEYRFDKDQEEIIITVGSYFDVEVPFIILQLVEIQDKETEVKALINLRTEAVELFGKFINCGPKIEYIDYLCRNCTESEFTHKHYILDKIPRYAKVILIIDDIITDREGKLLFVNKYTRMGKSKMKNNELEGKDINEEFLNLFLSAETGEKVIILLLLHEYIDSNMYWRGQGEKRNSQLVDVLKALDELGLLKKYRSFTKVATIFYTRFGLKVGKGKGGDITDRALRDEYKNNEIEQFKRFFKPHFPKIN